MSQYPRMNKALPIHIERLRRHHGNFSAVSRWLEISPRTFRRARNGASIPSSTRSKIIMASKLISLQAMIRELVRSGEISPAVLALAWRKTHSS